MLVELMKNARPKNLNGQTMFTLSQIKMSFFVSNQKLPQQISQKLYGTYHRQCATSQGSKDKIFRSIIRHSRLKWLSRDWTQNSGKKRTADKRGPSPRIPDKALKMPETGTFNSQKSREIYRWRNGSGDFCSRATGKTFGWLSNDIQPSKCYETKL